MGGCAALSRRSAIRNVLVASLVGVVAFALLEKYCGRSDEWRPACGSEHLRGKREAGLPSDGPSSFSSLARPP